MNIKQAFKNILDSLKRVLLYINLGKYNHVIQESDIKKVKNSIEKIIDNEADFKKTKNDNEKLMIYKRVEKYKNFSIRDFIEDKIDKL